MKSNEKSSSEPQVLITRIFDAPLELVFSAWTDPKRLLKWHAPHGCSIQYRSIDVREGGAFHSCIKIPSGEECWCRGVYLEVKRPERIVYTIALADENGKLKQPDAVGKDPDWPAETTVTVTFDDIGGKTRLTLRQNVSEAVAKRTGAHPSWLSMLDRLEGALKE